MKKIKIQRLCLIFAFLFCINLNSCKVIGNVLQSPSDVDFSTPQRLQISFNKHIYDTTFVFNKPKFEIDFINKKDLINGACVSITENEYKITYKDMVFYGERALLTNSFLPCIIYSFLCSFEETIILDNYDKDRECHYVKRDVNGYFITLECYEKEDKKYYSMEIK